MAIVMLSKYFISSRKIINQILTRYQKDFVVLLEVIEEYGGDGSLTHFSNMLTQEVKAKGVELVSKSTSDRLKEATKSVREKFPAVLMLSGVRLTRIATRN